MTPDEKVRRAQEAERIINSTLYQEAWQRIRESLFEEWTASQDAKNREMIFHDFKAMDRLQTYFGSVITDGTLTRMAADRQRKLTKS
jgi:hypothetical protein